MAWRQICIRSSSRRRGRVPPAPDGAVADLVVGEGFPAADSVEAVEAPFKPATGNRTWESLWRHLGCVRSMSLWNTVTVANCVCDLPNAAPFASRQNNRSQAAHL